MARGDAAEREAEARRRFEAGREGGWSEYDYDGNGILEGHELEAYRSDYSEFEANERAAANAEHDAAWDEMSWEERQAARGRGEGRSTEDRPTDTNTWNDWSRGTPFEGWFGETYDQEASEAAQLAARRAAILGDLAESMPGEDELSVEYGNEGLVRDTTAEGALARSNWRDWAEGGFTDSDRAMMDESRRRAGMTARADREASLSALEARGMGGSGASLAASLSAGEGAADRGASMDAAMMGAVQQRQIGATGALADWASGETDYERGREGRNTDRENRTRESAAEAADRAYGYRQDHATLGLGMNPAGGADEATSSARDRRDEDEEGLFGAVGGLVTSF